MEKTIRGPRLPDIDSIKELASFRDHHDLTVFEHSLEEVREPVCAGPPLSTDAHTRMEKQVLRGPDR